MGSSKGFLGRKQFVCNVLVCHQLYLSLLCLVYIVILYCSLFASRLCNYMSIYLLFMYSYLMYYMYLFYSTRKTIQIRYSLVRLSHASRVPIDAHKISRHTVMHCHRVAATSSVYALYHQQPRCVQSEKILLASYYIVNRRG